MAVPPSSLPPLTPAQAALIPSRSLPIASQLSHLLAEFTTLSLSLFSVLSSSTPSPTSTSTIYASLSTLDQKLADILSLAAEHQRQQRHIDALVNSLRTTDLAWRSTTSTLHSSLSTLSPIIISGSLDRSLIASSAPSKAALTPSTLLSYARLLAPFTSAPPSSLFPLEQRAASMDPSGRGLPSGAFPPFPTEGAMRRGRLQFGQSGVDCGEVGEVGGEFSLDFWLAERGS